MTCLMYGSGDAATLKGAPGDRPGSAAGPQRPGRDPGRAGPVGAHQPVMGADDPAAVQSGWWWAVAVGAGGVV